jgi:long-subunit acyl-CoA synthetase (AMP-forming)
MAEALSYAIVSKGLCPEVEAEGRKWQFMGIQSRNRLEWCMTHVAGMHQNITTVPLYETIGLKQMKFVIKQTKLTTVSLSVDNLSNFLKMKKEDTEGEMASIKNLVLFEKNKVTPD